MVTHTLQPTFDPRSPPPAHDAAPSHKIAVPPTLVLAPASPTLPDSSSTAQGGEDVYLEVASGTTIRQASRRRELDVGVSSVGQYSTRISLPVTGPTTNDGVEAKTNDTAVNGEDVAPKNHGFRKDASPLSSFDTNGLDSFARDLTSNLQRRPILVGVIQAIMRMRVPGTQWAWRGMVELKETAGKPRRTHQPGEESLIMTEIEEESVDGRDPGLRTQKRGEGGKDEDKRRMRGGSTLDSEILEQTMAVRTTRKNTA
ncbi:hypothetical protein NMY22_g18604 [Coprinellus aureogranulatus]|nr:hypothetical protein NMY22_g18604 [Coprinellus aureogranulatus]